MQISFFTKPRQGYFIQTYQAHPPGVPRHFVGGNSPTAGCTQCDNDLITILLLDTSDVRLELPKIQGNRLQLVICPNCRGGVYTQKSAGEILPLPSSRSQFNSSASFLQLPAHSPVVIHAIPDRIAGARSLALEGRILEAGDWSKDFDWQAPSNQIGGMPPIPRNKIRKATCPLCSSESPFFACMVCPLVDPFSRDREGVDVIVFHLCRKCITVGANSTSVD